MEERKRCGWCCDGGIVQNYHDMEWGVPLFDDQKQFEFLMMEVMQCGLNWTMMLKKREIFRKCFDNFDFRKVAGYTEEKIQAILEEPGMIRSRRKVEAIIHNANRVLEIVQEFGSFGDYIWSFSGHKPILYKGHNKGCIPAANALSDRVSRDLKKRGFKYMGSITVYAHLQVCGVINDHTEECFRYHALLQEYSYTCEETEDER